MTVRKNAPLPLPDPVGCVSYRLRRAARMTAKFYDAALKPTGLRNTQFTLLAAITMLDDTSIGSLSDNIGTDATTLTRNLEVLQKRGLVLTVPQDDARVRCIQLSDLGKKLYAEALPIWHEAQDHITQYLGLQDWQAMTTQLQKIEDACS